MLRRPIRWLVRLAVVLTLLSYVVFVSDLKYDFLPPSIQRNLLFHPDDPIVTDIEIRECGWWTKCEPVSRDGKVRINKDLRLGRSFLGSSSAYVYLSMVNETELLANQPVVLNVDVGEFNVDDPLSELPRGIYDDLLPTVSSELELADPVTALHIAETAGWKLEYPKLALWVKRGKHVPNAAVSSVNVFFGDSVEFPVEGWKLTTTIPIGEYKNDKDARSEFAPRLAVKIGRNSKIERTPLRFRKDARFRIVQLADLHMSTGGDGVCDKPAFGDDYCLADERTTELVEAVLDLENADFVVFTGDQIFGDASPDPETAIIKAVAPVLRRRLPFAMVWGNHDDQGPYSRQQLMNFVMGLPGAHISTPDAGVSGVGNYMVDVAAYASDAPALTMYFLDSHTKLKSAKHRGYDHIKPDQHELLRKLHAQQSLKLQGYAHVPLSMAFFHIPLPEYRDTRLIAGGTHREGVIAPVYNSGTLQVLNEIGVSVVSVGHDHANDFCAFAEGNPEDEHSHSRLWLCYGGSAGFGGYGGYPGPEGMYRRRVRVFELNMDVPSIKTWHRVERGEGPEDELVLVNNGVAVFPYDTQT